MGEDRFEPEKAVWREGHFIYTCKDEEEFAGEKWEGEWKYVSMDNCLGGKSLAEMADGGKTGVSPENWQAVNVKGQAGARS